MLEAWDVGRSRGICVTIERYMRDVFQKDMYTPQEKCVSWIIIIIIGDEFDIKRYI